MNKSLLRIICTTFLMIVGTITPQLLANNDAANLTKAQTWTDNTSNQTHFIENKGQIMQTDGQPAVYVSHLLERGNANIYLLREGGIAYQFNRMHYPEGYQELMADLKNEHENMEKMQEMQKEIRLETFRMDMHLVDANPNAEIITEGKSHDYTNYYTHDALFVHHYQKIIFKNIYSGIDWVIYTTEEGGLKYDFIVQPGADPSVIKMKFTHQEELYLDEKGNLIHGNRLGSFTEKAPVSFQEDKSIATQFVLNDNTLSFAIENYDPNLPLTIDPARVWGTYYGGGSGATGFFCNTDASGNVYLTGHTNSTNDIASGGYQNIHGGAGLNSDAFLVKFNSSGVRQWSTYLGGNGDDYGFSCVIDGSGYVYLSGETESTNNIASGGHQNTIGGSRDAFLVKFDSSGIFQWGTYYGDSSYERHYSSTVDNNGDVYMLGSTESSSNIAFGGHQNTYAGNGDVFLVKFNSSGVRLWSTYYGGSDIDNHGSCTTDNNGNVYIVGDTKSTTNIASGGHQNTHGDGGTSSDVFIVKFNSSGIRQWSTYYGGNNSDANYSCTTDFNGNLYVAGITTSTNNISFNGHQNTLGGGNDAFLIKFDSLGILQWGTYYGGFGHESGNGCSTDINGNIYLAGVTYSNNNIALGGYQNIFGGGYTDAFLVKFDSLGVRQWGTYYGGNGFDVGKSCALDGNGNIYFSGWTDSPTNIAFGGHQNIKGGSVGANNAFLAKFRINCHFTGNDVVTSCTNFSWIDNNTYTSSNNTATFLMLNGASNGCDSVVTLNLTINRDTVANIITACDSITWLDNVTYTSSTNSPIYTIVGGAYNGCDSVINLNLTIHNSTTNNQNISICQGDSVLISGTYQNTAGTYYDSLQTVNGCDSVIATTLTINPNYFNTNYDTICQGDSILIGGVYQTTAGTYYDSLQTFNGCDSIVEVVLSVDTSLTAYFTKTIDPNDSLNLLITNLATGNNLQYLWDFGDGNTSTQAYPNHTYATIGVYNLCLTITDSLSGCSSIFCDSTTVMRTTGVKTIQVISSTTSIDEVDYLDNISLFPNPTQNTFTLNLIETKSTQILVTSIEGKIMYNKVINNNNVEIDASKWANGLYFVNVMINNQQKVFKLIKQ